MWTLITTVLGLGVIGKNIAQTAAENKYLEEAQKRHSQELYEKYEGVFDRQERNRLVKLGKIKPINSIEQGMREQYLQDVKMYNTWKQRDPGGELEKFYWDRINI